MLFWLWILNMERQLWKEHSDKVLGKKIRIRNKHPGSATLYWTINGSLTATDTIITPLFEPSTLSHSKNYNSLCLIQQTVLRHTEIYLYLEARIRIRVKSWIWIQNSILIKKKNPDPDPHQGNKSNPDPQWSVVDLQHCAKQSRIRIRIWIWSRIWILLFYADAVLDHDPT